MIVFVLPIATAKGQPGRTGYKVTGCGPLCVAEGRPCAQSVPAWAATESAVRARQPMVSYVIGRDVSLGVRVYAQLYPKPLGRSGAVLAPPA